MGVRSVLQAEPVEVAKRHLADTADEFRRKQSERRMLMYRDNAGTLVEEEILRVFDSAAVQRLIRKMLVLAGSPGFYRRMINETAGPLYRRPPLRRVEPEADAEVYADILKETRADAKLDFAAHVLNMQNDFLIFGRYIPRLGRINLDVLPCEITSVVHDPDDPSVPLAAMYKSTEYVNGVKKDAWAYWDDAETFKLVDGQTASPASHPLGRLPFIWAHRGERVGCFYDPTTGKDLESAHLAISLLWALVFRLHKSQGWRQLVLRGDMDSIPQQQILAEEGPLVTPREVDVQPIDLATPPDHYLKSIETLITNTAANHGLSRDRLNQVSKTAQDDVALLERRAEGIKIFRRVEQDLFDLIKVISKARTKGALSDEAKLVEVDFPDMETEVSRLEQLKVRDEEERLGFANRLEQILLDNPELGSLEEARKKYERNIQIRGERIEKERALNMPQQPDSEGPGQDPEDNGRLGPAARGADAPIPFRR